MSDFNTSLGGQQVTCRRCKHTYRCTPADDYYNATTATDGVCFGCLLAENNFQPKQVVVVDATRGCHRGCPDGECYCAEPTYASLGLQCPGCGSMDGDCYCQEPS